MCGPPSLIAATRAIWERAGVGERVHSESFLPATVAAGTQGGRVRFARSDVEVSSDGRSLLEQAELAGLSPDLRLPDGHLPHVHHPQAVRPGT